MRLVLVLAVLTALALAASAAGAARFPTSLTITVWPEGRAGSSSQTWTLRCAKGKARGTLPGRASACRRLLTMTAPFKPVPKDAACTQIYGGPQQAFVRGTFKSKRVWVQLSLSDGCQIGRWDRVRFLLPSA